MKLLFAQQRSKNIKEHKCNCIFEYRSCSSLLVFWPCIWLTSTCHIDHFLWWNIIQQLHKFYSLWRQILPQVHSQDSDQDSLDSWLVPAVSCRPQHNSTATEKALSAHLGNCPPHFFREIPKRMKMEQSAHSYLYLMPAGDIQWHSSRAGCMDNGMGHLTSERQNSRSLFC